MNKATGEKARIGAGFNVCGDDCRRKAEGEHLSMSKTKQKLVIIAKEVSKPKDHDPVNHPSHYTSHPSGVECITITRHMTANIAAAMKYLWRNGLKDGVPATQDLEKAVFYIKDEIKRIEEQQNKTP